MKVFDVVSFLEAYSINYATSGKNWQPGWVQIACPMCDDSSTHGGFNLASGSFNCWKCGHHQTETVVMELRNCSFREAKEIIMRFRKHADGEPIERRVAEAKECNWPEGTEELPVRHRLYMGFRDFDPDVVAPFWKLKGTGAVGAYKFRIIAPIFVDGVMVSYQGRDITDRQTLRYKACAIEKEVIHHKHVVYGIDYVNNRRCIIVEGITDVWRLGPGSVALFGSSWTNEQLLFLKDRVDEGLVLFDSDSTDKGTKLMSELNSLGMNFGQACIKEGDPGNFSKEEVEYAMNLIS